MNANKKTSITLGADVGGKDAHANTHEHVLALRKLLAQECQGSYSDVFDELALMLRIDGSVQSWGKKGVDNVKLLTKSRYATADIFVPEEVWRRDADNLREFIAEGVVKAINEITDAASEANMSLTSKQLGIHVRSAVEKYLKPN